MNKFWPARKTFKGSVTNKMYSERLHEKLDELLFNDDDGLVPSVPARQIISVDAFRDVKVTIDPRTYANDVYSAQNWANTNYFKSDFNNFDRRVKFSYWKVTKADIQQDNSGRIISIEYSLHLDEWTTFFEYFKELHGSVNIKEMHNDRWIKTEDNKYSPDLVNAPYINNCNDYCKRFDHKIQPTFPYQTYDTKHFDLDLKPRTDETTKKFFEVTNGKVTKQIRGWIVVFVQPVKSGDIQFTTFDKTMVLPYHTFLYGVTDDFDPNDYLEGIKGIQKVDDKGEETNYRIITSNLIGDILDYNNIQSSSITSSGKWYEGNNFTTSNTLGMIDTESFGKFVYDRSEIFGEQIEPHLNSMTHKHFEVQNISKTPVSFDINRLIQNNGLLQKPNESEGPKEVPLIKNFSLFAKYGIKKIPTLFKDKDGNMFCIIKNGKELNGSDRNQTGTATILTAKTGNLEEFLKTAVEKEINLKMFRSEAYSSNIMLTPSQTFGEWVDKNGEGCSDASLTVQSGGYFATGNSIIFKEKYFRFNKLSRVKNVTGSPYQNWMAPETRNDTFANNIFVAGNSSEGFIQLGITPNEINNAGNYTANVIGYAFTSFSNGKFNATHWYVMYQGDLYKLPIGKLVPDGVTMVNKQEFFYYNDKILYLLRNLGWFSSEQMGIKNVLLDTDTSFSSKLNNNILLSDVTGTFNYPYYDNSYNEWLRARQNQLATGFNNIDAKRQLGRKQAWQDFGKDITKGIIGGGVGGALGGGGMRGVIGGGLIGAAGRGAYGGLSLSQRLAQIDLDAKMSRDSMNAEINDAKNLADNIHTTGVGTTLSDMVLKGQLQTHTLFENYWSYWTPVIAKFELTPTDKLSLRQHFNKYGYEQDRTLTIENISELTPRYAFNRLRIANSFDIMLSNGFSEYSAIDTAEELNNGVWIWNLDNIDYDDVLDFSINNIETKVWVEEQHLKQTLDKSIEGALN